MGNVLDYDLGGVLRRPGLNFQSSVIQGKDIMRQPIIYRYVRMRTLMHMLVHFSSMLHNCSPVVNLSVRIQRNFT